MTGVHIRTVTTAKGKRRYVVRYRLGGRGFKLIHAGSFETVREARLRRDLIAGELAAGRDPRLALRALQAAKPQATMRQTGDAWISSLDAGRRHSPATVAQYRAMLPTALEGLADLLPSEVTVGHLQAWVAAHAGLRANTLRQGRTILRAVLDHAGIDPNPARDPRLKLPRETREEPVPPPADHVLAILERLPARLRLPFAVLEQTGMRVNELHLTWADVDEPGRRFRLRAATTKTARARWVQLPDWLMALVSDTCPLEDRILGRRVFPGVTDDTLRGAIRRACQTAGIPHYHPHDLRHRRISLWHASNVPWKAIAERVGQSRASVTIDVYSHVMPVDELPDESWRTALVRHP